MEKVKSAKHIRFGTVGDSPYTQKIKNNNQQIIERIKLVKNGRLSIFKVFF